MTGCELCGVGPEDECSMDCPSREIQDNHRRSLDSDPVKRIITYMDTTTTPAALKFTRDKLTGFYSHRVTAERETYRSSDGECVLFTTDSVRFRISPVHDYSTDSRRIGYRCMVFANGETIFDSGENDNFDRLAFAKAFLTRLAHAADFQAKAVDALNGHKVHADSRHSEAFSAALDDYYGRTAA